MMLFDGLLAVLLVVLAWRCLTVSDLFRSIVLFIILGLLLALAWARLQAPDLALAEAAIGAGLLGVLLLGTWRAIGSPRRPTGKEVAVRGWIRGLSVAASTGIAVVAALALHLLPEPMSLPLGQSGEAAGGPAGVEALALLEQAGTQQPVTAVLLNFRSYDTLLEMGVLLVALLGTLLARSPLMTLVRHDDATEGTPLMPAIVSVFTPVLLLVGAYLIWAGTHSPGGAFQGGAVLAGCGVLLALTDRLRGHGQAGLLQRGLLVLGLAVFSLAGLLVMPWQGSFLAYPQALVYPLMLGIEYSLAASIAITLVLLFTGTPALRRHSL